MQDLIPIPENTLIGMNNRYPPHLLERGLFQLIKNSIIDRDKIQKRKGTNPVAASLGTQDILGLSAFQPSSKYIIACLNGASNSRLYSWTGSGSFSAIGSANLTKDLQMNFVQAANILYGFNGTDAVSVDSSLIVTKNPATVPQGLVGAWFHNYLFVANTSGFPNRLFFSNLGDPTTFSPTDFVDINAKDGDQITALAIFNDELYVFKNNTIWSITGFSGSSFAATTTLGENTNNKIYGYGTPSQKSVVITGKDMYYLSFLGNIPHFRSFVQTQFSSTLEQGIVSFDIEQTMSGLATTQLSKVAGIYDGKYIYWGVPDGGSTYNNLILVLEPSIKAKGKTMTSRSWVTWNGFNPAQFTSSSIGGTNAVYFGDGSKTGNVSSLNYSVYADNGVAVSMDVRTRDYQMDGARKAKWKYLYFEYATGSPGSLNINAHIDEAVDFTSQQVLSLRGTSPGLGPTGTFTLGVSVLGGSTIVMNRTPFAKLIGHSLGVQFLEQTSNSVEIENVVILGKLKGYRKN